MRAWFCGLAFAVGCGGDDGAAGGGGDGDADTGADSDADTDADADTATDTEVLFLDAAGTFDGDPFDVHCSQGDPDFTGNVTWAGTFQMTVDDGTHRVDVAGAFHGLSPVP
jgi:hypothetical protein